MWHTDMMFLRQELAVWLEVLLWHTVPLAAMDLITVRLTWIVF